MRIDLVPIRKHLHTLPRKFHFIEHNLTLSNLVNMPLVIVQKAIQALRHRPDIIHTLHLKTRRRALHNMFNEILDFMNRARQTNIGKQKQKQKHQNDDTYADHDKFSVFEFISCICLNRYRRRDPPSVLPPGTMRTAKKVILRQRRNLADITQVFCCLNGQNITGTRLQLHRTRQRGQRIRQGRIQRFPVHEKHAHP